MFEMLSWATFGKFAIAVCAMPGCTVDSEVFEPKVVMELCGVAEALR